MCPLNNQAWFDAHYIVQTCANHHSCLWKRNVGACCPVEVSHTIGMLLHALKLFVCNPPFTSNKSDLAGEQALDKGRWNAAPPLGLPAVSWNFLNKAALLVTEPTGKHELDEEQTGVLNLLPDLMLHPCSTATVVRYLHLMWSSSLWRRIWSYGRRVQN